MLVPRPSKAAGRQWCSLGLLLCLLLPCAAMAAGGAEAAYSASFPPPLDSYNDAHMTNSLGKVAVMEVLKHRVEMQPFNLVASLLFLGAIIHTFLTQRLRHIAHELEVRHKERIRQTGRTAEAKGYEGAKDDVSFRASLFHFLGEVEAVFGIWVIPLMVMMVWKVGAEATLNYVDHRVGYHEPIFVVVIMALSATRPVLNLAEELMRRVAMLAGGGLGAWWFTILTLGPLLGSFITEPAAMTISASLLARQFYSVRPPQRLAYATLGLLFVNVSVGGTLSNFAAPPVLMVAEKWMWSMKFMFTHFGWQAAVGIVGANTLYFLWFRKDFAVLATRFNAQEAKGGRIPEPVPTWVTFCHLLFMAWAVVNAHHPAFLVGGFLFFLAFYQATEQYQFRLELRSPILVGFFLAGLVTHGGLQQWWIGPVLRSLGEFPMFVGATVLTAFNDNAAITYLATLVPGMSDAMKHAVVAGAVTGGGLTVIANAPNPAGQSILNRYFEDGISPLGLFLGALIPTVILGAAMWLLY
ncbi:MAG: putative Na+/H+ antiporter [Verrucomicrobia bacterium]|nr:putative Na+/H+ antiporter [Verrucomicrobiota bacterium]